MLQRELREIAAFVRDRLAEALESRPIRNRLEALDERAEAEMRRGMATLEENLKAHGLVPVHEVVGQLVRVTIHVRQTGRTITQHDLANLVARGQVSRQEFEKIRGVIKDHEDELAEVSKAVNRIWKQSRQLRRNLLRAETRRLMADLVAPLGERLRQPDVDDHLESLINDVIEHRVDQPAEHQAEPDLIYSANVIAKAGEPHVPVVEEPHPTPRNLIGTIDPSWLDAKRAIASFRGIRAGSAMQADEGFLLVHAGALLEHPDSVDILHRLMVLGAVDIEPPGRARAFPIQSLRPDPIPLRVRLVLIGAREHWERMHDRHPEFMRRFGAPVDVTDSVERGERTARALGLAIRRRCEALKIAAPGDEALARLVEHAARMAGDDRLSRRVDELVDIAGRAAAVASETGEAEIGPEHVARALEMGRPSPDPAGGPESLGFPGAQPAPGQVYAAAVDRDGPFHVGRISRVRASTMPSSETRFAVRGRGAPEGLEGDLEAVLARVLRLERRPAVRAILTMEARRQLGETRPDPVLPSALLAGSLALLSHLSGVALRQDVAVLGALDLDARVQPVPNLNDCVDDLLTPLLAGELGAGAGVLVPAPQRKALMLCDRIVQAASNDRVQVYAAGNLSQALELLAGSNPGVWRDGSFPSGSLYGRARERLTGIHSGASESE